MHNFGRYFEDLITKSFIFYNQKKESYFFKYSLKILNLHNKSKISVGTKGDLDYYGVIKGKFIAIEAKSVKENNFLSKHNFSKEQIIKMHDLLNLQAQVFVFVYFANYDIFFFVESKKLLHHYKSSSKITYKQICAIGQEVLLIFPGILDLKLFFQSIVI